MCLRRLKRNHLLLSRRHYADKKLLRHFKPFARRNKNLSGGDEKRAKIASLFLIFLAFDGYPQIFRHRMKTRRD